MFDDYKAYKKRIELVDNCLKCGMAYPTELHNVRCLGPDNVRDIIHAQDRARNLVFNFNQEAA